MDIETDAADLGLDELAVLRVLRGAAARSLAWVSLDDLSQASGLRAVELGEALRRLRLLGVVANVDDHSFRFALQRDPLPVGFELRRGRKGALAA